MVIQLGCILKHGQVETSIYTLLKKIKGTLKQHNVTPSQSHFCEIKLST
jgi:hypothetical protein